MKITDIRWTPAFIPIEASLRYAFGSHPGFSRFIIEVDTDEGITGLGECYSGASRAGQLAEMKPLLIGADPMNLERIRWKVAAPSSVKLFGNALGFAGIEFAILDIQGKALKMPVCDLLGGRIRDEVPFSAYLFYRYANDAGKGEVSNTVQMVGFAKDLVKLYGFKTLKYKNGVFPPDEEIETFIALREAFPKHRIRLDPNAAWTPATSLDVARELVQVRDLRLQADEADPVVAAGQPLGCDSPRALERLTAALEAAARGESTDATPHRGGDLGRAAAFTITPAVSVDNEASDEASVIEVSGRDRPGLLGAIARTLAEAGLSIQSAHIDNYGERAVDAFYCHGPDGGKLTGARSINALKAALNQALDEEPAEPAEGRPRLERARASIAR